MLEEECEYIFTWKIKNYSACYQENGEKIISPTFDLPILYGGQWCILFYPKGDLESKKFVSCYLRRDFSEESNEAQTAKYSFRIVDEMSSVLKATEFKKKVFTKKEPGWGYGELFAVNTLSTEMRNWEDDILTLHCHIKHDKLQKHAVLRSEACTTINVDKACGEWKVKISTLSKYSESISFPISHLYNFELILTFGLETATISIRLEKGQLPCKVSFKMSIFDYMGCRVASKRAEYLFESSRPWQFPSFITNDLIKACQTGFSHCEFKLNCEAYISNRSISSIKKFQAASSVKLVSKKGNVASFAILNDFRDIFVSQKYSDVRMRTGNEEFPAHKFVLKVRSPVFAAMFNQDMIEKQTGVVEITDMDGKVLKIFLEFIYTGILEDVDYESAKTLLLAADKYEVLSLVDECAYILKSVLSIENVCEVITVADMVHCESLKSCALNFVADNAAQLLPSPSWSQWIAGNVKLASYVLSKLSEDIGSKYKLK